MLTKKRGCATLMRRTNSNNDSINEDEKNEKMIGRTQIYSGEYETHVDLHNVDADRTGSPG